MRKTEDATFQSGATKREEPTVNNSENRPVRKRRPGFYTNYEETPMAFHKFNLYFRLPLAIIMSAGLAVNGYISLPSILPFLQPYEYFEISVYLCVFILLIVTIFGLSGWKYKAWLSQQIALILIPSYYLFLVIFRQIMSQKYPSIDAGPSLGSFIGNALVNILVFVYYQKRKLLFSDVEVAKEETITFIDPEKMGPSSCETHASPIQDMTILDAARSFSAHQSECIRIYPDFNFTDEMNNKKTGETFGKLLDSGMDMKTAYEFVHRNELERQSDNSSADNIQSRDALSPADYNRKENLDKATERLLEIRKQAEQCKKLHPDFDYTEEMDNPISGQAFSKLIDSGVDVCGAYTFVHQKLNDGKV